jgi:type IV pilus assembly protein PilC
MENAQALKRKVIGAMIYPIAVMSFALAIVTGLLIYVVPSFAEIFQDMDVELPGVTKALLALSKWVAEDYGWAVILGSPILLFLVVVLLKTSDGGRYFVDTVKLKIPILGTISYKSSVARFTRTLGTLLAAGVPILDALTITAETAGNEVYTRALKDVRDGIREGESFAQPLRQAKVCEAMVVNMIDVGEETGELDRMLDKIADTYESEVDTLVSSMTSLLEPIMVISLGGIVGFIVLALFMPMVSLIENVSAT